MPRCLDVLTNSSVSKSNLDTFDTVFGATQDYASIMFSKHTRLTYDFSFSWAENSSQA